MSQATAKVPVTLYNRDYMVNCGVGEEERLKEIVQFVEDRMHLVSGGVGNTTESRLFMLTCLSLADEVLENRRRAEKKIKQDEELLVAAVEHLKERITTLASQVA